MQEDRNDHRPKMPLTGFINYYYDSDSESLYATTTVSIIFIVTICGNPLFSGSTSQKAKSLVSYDSVPLKVRPLVLVLLAQILP